MKLRDAIVLLPVDSLEELSLDQQQLAAESFLVAWTVPFHPALLASLGQTVHWEPAEHLSDIESLAETLILIPTPSEGFLPNDWIEQAEASGALVVRDLTDRDTAVRQVLSKLDPRPNHIPFEQLNAELVADQLALGLCHFLIELLTRHQYYLGSLDEEGFDHRSLRAAEAIVRGDEETAREELQNAFDVLTEGREYFYSLEPCLIDFTLTTPGTIGKVLTEELADDASKTILLSGQTMAAIAESEPETLEILKKALAEQKIDLVGGEFSETALGLAVPEAILADLHRGLSTYEKHLGKRPTVFARRRFGLTPLLPQILKHCDFAAACHFTLDGGRFPTSGQSKILWEGAGGISIPAIAGMPADASSVESFLRLPGQLADAMDLDEAPSVIFAHWPGRVSCWYDALRRMDSYGPALGRFMGISDYFDETTDSAPAVPHGPDEYQSPYLVDSVEKGLADPVSRWVRYNQRHAIVDSVASLRCMASAISGKVSIAEKPDVPLSELKPYSGSPGDSVGCLGHSEAVAQDKEELGLHSPQTPTSQLGEDTTTLRHEIDELANTLSHESEEPRETSLDQRLADVLDKAAGEVAQVLPRSDGHKSSGRLYLNPWSFARTCGTIVEDAGQSQQTVPATKAEVPPMGFVWLDSDAEGAKSEKVPSSPQKPFWQRKKSRPLPPMAEENVVRNEFFEATVDPITGSLRSIHDYHTRGNRLASQLALRAPELADAANPAPRGQRTYSIMAAERVEAVNRGQNEGQIDIHGRLVDRRGRRVAGFRQTLRARRGSRVLELDIELLPEHVPEPRPWQSYYAVRFAWDNTTAELFRSVNLTSWPTEALQFEAPHFIEIGETRRRTTILTGGLPFHRRTGPRQLDCLLVVRGETSQRFRLGIGIDLPHPAAAALDFLAPRLTPIELAHPPKNRSGWLFHVDTPNVIATAWEPLVCEGRLAGCRVRLLETEGHATQSRLRLFRQPTKAEQTDYLGNIVKEMQVENDYVSIDLKAHQWIQTDIHWH